MTSSNIDDALSAFETDEIVKGALGPHIFEHFIEAKEIEWDMFRSTSSPMGT